MCRNFIENSTVTDLVETLPTFYEAQMSTTVFPGTRDGTYAEHEESTENVKNLSISEKKNSCKYVTLI
jgi:hypothetical protein